MQPLQPSAYAPYRNPRDYILSWTDKIWIDLAIGKLNEHYGQDVKVHTAYGETYDFDTVHRQFRPEVLRFPERGRRPRGGRDLGAAWAQRVHQFPQAAQGRDP